MKNAYKIRLALALLIFILSILGFAGFYPAKVPDLQFGIFSLLYHISKNFPKVVFLTGGEERAFIFSFSNFLLLAKAFHYSVFAYAAIERKAVIESFTIRFLLMLQLKEKLSLKV